MLGGLRGPDSQHFFCGNCLTWMFTRPVPMPSLVNVRPTMFDDAAWFSPFLESFTNNQLPRAATGAVHWYAEFPPMDAYDALVKEYASLDPS